MRLAISNIAWEAEQDPSIAALLSEQGIDAIDVAPGKYFADPLKASDSDIARVRRWWAGHGIEIVGMQALLFGTSGLNLFGTSASQLAMLHHLSGVCRIGAGLGATRLVFGSPKNRDRSGLDDAQTRLRAIDFFQALGDMATTWGVSLCLEPNPVCYGANFMTDSVETAEVVQAVNHPAIRMQLDTGALTLNGEKPFQVLQQHAGLIGHVHASEPNLLPLGDGTTDHARMAEAVRRYLPRHLVTIEMLSSPHEPAEWSIGRALAVARQHYGSTPS